MVTIPGYTIGGLLYESSKSLIYRGWRESDLTPVILKLLNQDYPSSDTIACFQLEYNITRSLSSEGVIKAYSLEAYQHSLVMILEDFGGESLNQYKTFTLEEFLTLAIKITKILGGIHQQNVIHKDINPSNIVLNTVNGQVKFIDFGISSLLLRENFTLLHPNILEGTVAYMSPEQTGRMNRVIDYRTDFYSLGVTFYECLCKKVPFDTTDVMELVHCHIAKQPISPHEFNSEIPQVVSNLVMKLLAKNAEERYQSSWGIQADLQECLQQLQTKEKIETFELGCHDIADKFQIPQKLYGREREIETLLAAFERVAFKHHKTEMVLVSGYSGIGKTALVQEIYKPITKTRGYFIAGKFDPFGQNIPYSGFIQAFRELVKQLLTENETQIVIWREKLLSVLGVNGQIIIDVIPEIERIIGKQPAILELRPTELQNRFNLVLQNFINVFTQSEHPLVIFLDDLQWSDKASLRLIQMLMTTPNSQYLFLIGTYRENEVNAMHPLKIILEKMQHSAAIINHISLLPLTFIDINQLIADTLSCNLERAKLLAELVEQKTDGNPFFINVFLKSLYQEKLLYFDIKSNSWQWNLQKIREKNFTDNVIDLMVTKIQKLPESIQQVLKLAACIGNQFDSKTLLIIYEQSQAETITQLWQAVQEGLIIPVGDDYKYFQSDEKLMIHYKFLHDKIRQSAYSLISEIDQKQLHLKIGQLLLKSTPNELLNEKIFDIVNHLNLGIKLITECIEKKQFAKLNLMAGKKAKASAAYETALNYANIGKELLEKESWLQSYQLTLELYNLAAESAYLCGDFEQMQQLAEVILQQGKTLLDKLKGYEVKIQAFVVQNKFLEAIQTTLEALKLLGVNIPNNPSRWDILAERTKTKLALAGKSIQRLLDLPQMSDPDKLAAMRIIAIVCTPTYFLKPQLWQLMVFQKIRLSLKYGNAPGSPFGYADYGMVLCAVEGDIDKSYQFSQLALNLLHRLNPQEFKPKTCLLVNIYLRHWKEHLHESLNPLLETYEQGLETGDLEYAVFAAVFHFYYAYLVGKELKQLEREMAIYEEAIAKFKQEMPLYFHKIHHQTVLNLIVPSENPYNLSGKVYNETQCLPLHEAINDQHTIFHLYCNKSMLCYLFGNYTKAIEHLAKAEKLLLAGAIGMLVVPIFYFYDSLSNIAVFFQIQPTKREKILRKVTSNQQKMKKWADSAPMNYLHKYYLVEAEWYRVLGENGKAIEYYDRAITLAHENEYIQEEALAQELAAKFYLANHKPKIAQVYLLDAYYNYLKWGATAKVKDLESQYPQCFERILEKKQLNTNFSTTTNRTKSEILDLATVIKASQALSGEMVLDKLLIKMMKILIENAGAQKGVLILETQGKLLIEAEGSINSDTITVLQSIPLDNHLPVSIINYVAHTQENIVIHNAVSETPFNDQKKDSDFFPIQNPKSKIQNPNDPYIIQYQPKSILCIPLINQGKLSGILYLENNLTTDAFTCERVEVLQLLSTQAAIAIDNARLYNELEIRVKERTIELSQANQKLEHLTTELQRSNQELEQFAYIASHDLQEPLRAVASYTQMLAKRYQGKLDEKADIYIGFAVDGAIRMQKLIQDLLAYSRVGRHQLKQQLTDCNLVVNKVLNDLQVTITENQAEIIVDSLPSILADTAQITLLFQNLISNAIKYRRQATPQVRISAIQEEMKWRFSVRDNGIGIEPQYIEQIFGIFQRLHSSDEYAGTGLGLAICQKIVERHGGHIWAESQPGEGSVFYFEIFLTPNP